MKIRLCVFIVLCFCSLGNVYAGDDGTKIDWNETEIRIERPLLRSGMQPLSAYINNSAKELEFVFGYDLGPVTVNIIDNDGGVCYSVEINAVQRNHSINTFFLTMGQYTLEVYGRNDSYWQGSFRL